jgi:CheY-like chemotaxis protein
MMPRPDHPDSSHPSTVAASQSCPGEAHRLNLLLSCARWRHDAALEQLPHLLGPLGIRSLSASSGEEAADLIRSFQVHIAVVDLSIPLQRDDNAPAARQEAGPRVLQLLRRLDQPPPTGVVRPAQPASREAARSLTQALREGAFAVLDRPVRLESMLEVLRRILHRHYADCWPV